MNNPDSISSAKQQQNIWFAISFGLMGIIIGYVLAMVFSGSLAVRAPDTVKVPTPAPSAAPDNQVPTGPVPPVDAKTDHILGKANAKVSLIVYSDFECPFSKRHHPTLTQILDAYKDDVNVVYRHYPLGFHANAQKEAEASECAAELGGNDAFWKFTDGIYAKTTSNGTGFALADLGPLAKSVGINQAKFQSCLDSGKYAAKVKDEMDKGSAAGVEGTPGNILIVNKTKESKLVSGALPFASFKTTIDSLLGK